MRIVLALIVCMSSIGFDTEAVATDRLAEGFASPPAQARPWVYWWWLNGNVTRQGITRDLEEMKRQGIGGVLIFHAGGGRGAPMGPKFLSPEWRGLFRHAIREAGRLGIDVSVNMCDGWDAGGPWIRPEQANLMLVHSETQIDGPGKQTVMLPRPKTVDDYYRDVTVLAIREQGRFPVVPVRIAVSSTHGGYADQQNWPSEQLADRDPRTIWKAGKGPEQWVQYEYAQPLRVTSVLVVASTRAQPVACELGASQDGHDFRRVAVFRVAGDKPQKVTVAPTSARFFRLSIRRSDGKEPVELAEMWLLRDGDEAKLRPGVKWWWFKSGNYSFWDWPRRGPAVLDETYSDAGSDWDCRGSEVVDLTSKMDASGKLDWDMPPGRWSVLRFGSTLEGQRTRAAAATVGYESNMLDSAGIERHFEHVARPILDDAKAASPGTLKYLHIDSYELGCDVRGQQPTWSKAFREEFRARRGYDPLPYLPAMARRIVDDRQRTNRFLWDYRRTIGDLMAERFFKRFAELAHEQGVGVHAETGYGTCPHPHIDGLQCAGLSDVPMGEFWYGTDIMSQFDHFCNAIRSVASAGHVYGRPVIQAEAFTNWFHFREDPSMLKPVGDAAFCDGLNRMVLHQYTHQPTLDIKPGWKYFAGTHFDRNLTWWNQAHGFFTYLARCQYLLQQGRPCADVCYFYGDGATEFVPGKPHIRPALPEGYDFDMINADVLTNRLTVRDGRLGLPGGLSYWLLVLPEEPVLSPATLHRLKALVEAGATMLGPKPKRAPGLTDYPRCDQEVAELANAMWGPGTSPSGRRRVGKGQVVWGQSVGKVLGELEVSPDFECRRRGDAKAALTPSSSSQERGEEKGNPLHFVHRSLDEGTEVYFVSNQQDQTVQRECVFRVLGKQPELWNPVSGKTCDAEAFEQANGRTSLPLRLAPFESMFVVFQRPISKNASGAGRRNWPREGQSHPLDGPWNVHFDPKWGGPESITFDRLMDWTEHSDPGIRGYSGTATYTKTFDLPEVLRRGNRRVVLDLGVVKNVAEVRLNGRDLGVVWTAPRQVDLTGIAKPTDNTLEIKVVNLWLNRVFTDQSLPPEKRLTKTNARFRLRPSLLPSGLLGPVRIVEYE
ncbi:MAG: discoidin domain-containing protein [Pirellulales bacterium]|nr:discoidin domain-containing protein [Pirellulales bacterium]